MEGNGFAPADQKTGRVSQLQVMGRGSVHRRYLSTKILQFGKSLFHRSGYSRLALFKGGARDSDPETFNGYTYVASKAWRREYEGV